MSVGDIMVHLAHYSQYANYLRLNGLLPPTAKKTAP